MGGATIFRECHSWEEAVDFSSTQIREGNWMYDLWLRFASISYNQDTKKYEVVIRLVK